MIALYFHTIRNLKFKQIYYRIWFFLSKPKIKNILTPPLRILNNKFILPILKNNSLLTHDEFTFLNKSAKLSKIGWEGNSHVSKLWRYNQHYFDYLISQNYQNHIKSHQEILKHWLNENKVGQGVGWDSYPTSLRIVNWIKWNLLGNTLSDKCIQSLAIQARWLNKRVEWHILGNHLFSNAKALLFVGLFFSNKESDNWINKSLVIIDKEIEEQILNDGGHFELSPMYHNIFLEDLLDLINVSKTYPKAINVTKINKWNSIVFKMLRWSEIMSHPDGGLSFFNDSCHGIAPKFNHLLDYAKKLGIKYISIKNQKIVTLNNSGYCRITSKGFIGFLDVARVGPDYLPGHAHADTLSFEISLFGKRFLVNGGTSDYENGPIRDYERSTEAHNTVTINDKNSSEVWNSFRVARRAYPFDLKIKDHKDLLKISCSHNGYFRFKNKVTHKREWILNGHSLIIKDSIKGKYKNAIAHFHFHPTVIIKKINNDKIDLKLGNKKVLLKIIKGKPIIKKSFYSQEFGKRLKTLSLKVLFEKDHCSCIKILW